MKSRDYSIDQVLEAAVLEARAAEAGALEPIHLMAALFSLGAPLIEAALRAVGIDTQPLLTAARNIARAESDRRELGRMSTRVMMLLSMTKQRIDEAKRAFDPALLLEVLLSRPDKAVAAFVELTNLPIDALLLRFRSPKENEHPPSGAPARKSIPTPTLVRYGKDYVGLARQDKFLGFAGRRQELMRVVQTLLREEKSNPVLVGEAGVGKTSIIEGLALLIISEDAPPQLAGMRIIEIGVSDLLAGTKYRGDLEERLRKLVAEASSDPNIVLFIDEIHALMSAGGHGDAASAGNLLKPALARGSIRIIGATTPDEYARFVERDTAFARRFIKVVVDEPTPEETKEMLEALRPRLEKHHGVRYKSAALAAAVELSVRYLPNRRLPDKARDLLDDAAASKRFSTFAPRKAADLLCVDAADIASVLADRTGIPVGQLTAGEEAGLRTLEDTLNREVVGQLDAVAAVAGAVRAARLGLRRTDRPWAVFLFTGPPGVGKTELAKALSRALFGGQDHLIRIDMSAYMERHSVSKLVGAPPGYQGHEERGQLIGAVQDNPYAVVLLDEIEKAHPDVMNVMLQIFDHGRLTDQKGRPVDFRNTIIIMTSNLGSDQKRHGHPIGFGADNRSATTESGSIDQGTRQALLSFLRPEMLDRIDRVVQFKSLGPSDLGKIVERLLERLVQRLANAGITLTIEEAVIPALVAQLEKQRRGPRQLEAAIERTIAQPLANEVVLGRLQPGAAVRLTIQGNRIDLAPERVTRTKQNSLAFARTERTFLSQVHPAREPQSFTMLLLDLSRIRKVNANPASATIGDGLLPAILSHPSATKMKLVKAAGDKGDRIVLLFVDTPSAIELARDLCRMQTANPLELGIVVHAGRLKIGPSGDPVGREMDRLLGVAELIKAGRMDSPLAPPNVQVVGSILITDQAFSSLSESQRRAFRLAAEIAVPGFDERQTIWVDEGRELH